MIAAAALILVALALLMVVADFVLYREETNRVERWNEQYRAMREREP